MAPSTSLPSDDQIKAFFATDKSLGRFVRFRKRLLLLHVQQLTAHLVQQHLFHARVTSPACAVIITAAYAMDTSTLPSPASTFFGCDEVQESQEDTVSLKHPDLDIVRKHQGGLPGSGAVTFAWLLTRPGPGVTTPALVQSSDIDFKALTAVLATASKTSSAPRGDAPCDHCLRGGALLIDECRVISVDELLESLDLGAPTCTNCFAADVACEWKEADAEEEDAFY
jgi:hypothetical protein